VTYRSISVNLSAALPVRKVIAPPTQDRIQCRDHITEIESDPIAAGAVTDLGPPPGPMAVLAGPAVAGSSARCASAPTAAPNMRRTGK